MNYGQIYLDLITSRSVRATDKLEYYEKHHILPKSLGGTDEDTNLVKLTAREHYLAHWLLTKIHPDSFKLLFAFSLMAGHMSPKGVRHYKASDYERCKKANILALKLRPGTPMTKANKELASDRMKANNPIANDPGKNHTAKPVIVTFEDGTSKQFAYGKLASDTLGIPYATWKYSRKHGKPGRIPKYKIKSIQQLEKAV